MSVFTDLKIIVAYEPLYMPGHFYFPLYKDERVLLTLSLNEARITRFLDWRPTARLAAATLGDNIVWGKKEGNQTTLGHTYVADKPELQLKRTNAKDHQRIHVLEGTLFIEVMEDKEEKKAAKKDAEKKAADPAAAKADAACSA